MDSVMQLCSANINIIPGGSIIYLCNRCQYRDSYYLPIHIYGIIPGIIHYRFMYHNKYPTNIAYLNLCLSKIVSSPITCHDLFDAPYFFPFFPLASGSSLTASGFFLLFVFL
jgi:hypothetical protein